jgi:RHS repeat-associated protein
MAGRQYNSSSYRYGFNKKERDPEGLGGSGATYDYGFRIYNPNIGRFLSIDPLTHSYPWYTPYQFASLNPILFVDLDGLEGQQKNSIIDVTPRGVVTRTITNETTKALAKKAATEAAKNGGKQLAQELGKKSISLFARVGAASIGTAVAVVVLVFTPANNGSGAKFAYGTDGFEKYKFEHLTAKESSKEGLSQEERNELESLRERYSYDENGNIVPKSSTIVNTSDDATHVFKSKFTGVNYKGFSKGKLAEHYDKHVVQQGEFGPITQAEYAKKAKEFISKTGGSVKEEVVGNFIVKYDPKTGEVAVGHLKDKEIRTYYIDDGRSKDPLADAVKLAEDLGNPKKHK